MAKIAKAQQIRATKTNELIYFLMVATSNKKYTIAIIKKLKLINLFSSTFHLSFKLKIIPENKLNTDITRLTKVIEVILVLLYFEKVANNIGFISGEEITSIAPEIKNTFPTVILLLIKSCLYCKIFCNTIDFLKNTNPRKSLLGDLYLINNSEKAESR